MVYVAKHRKTGELVALKKISKKFTNDTGFQREMDAFLRIRNNGGHPNICGLHDCFDSKEYYYLTLDLISGGEMFDHLCNNGVSIIFVSITNITCFSLTLCSVAF